MKALEFFNPRCNDAVFHYELAWPPGERPSRAQWTDAALYTLNELGFEKHQYVIVAHDDKKHFHIHIMVNKVHPITYRAHTPSFSWLTLDAAARFLEAKHGWAHTAGPTRWDEDIETGRADIQGPNVMRLDRPGNSRQGQQQSLNIITMRNLCKPTSGGK